MLQKSALLGSIVKLLLLTNRKYFKIAAIEPQIIPAIELGQARVWHDERSNPEAYATWAFITVEMFDELAKDENKLLHKSEWNEYT